MICWINGAWCQCPTANAYVWSSRKSRRKSLCACLAHMHQCMHARYTPKPLLRCWPYQTYTINMCTHLRARASVLRDTAATVHKNTPIHVSEALTSCRKSRPHPVHDMQVCDSKLLTAPQAMRGLWKHLCQGRQVCCCRDTCTGTVMKVRVVWWMPHTLLNACSPLLRISIHIYIYLLGARMCMCMHGHVCLHQHTHTVHPRLHNPAGQDICQCTNAHDFSHAVRTCINACMPDTPPRYTINMCTHLQARASVLRDSA